MPYQITDEHSECPTWAVVKTVDGQLMGCHATESEAQDQLTALNISEYGDEARADAPAPLKDQIKGSDTNKPGSAKGKSGGIVINEATEKGLKKKVKDHNDKMKGDDRPIWTRTTLGAVKAVYRRGAGAFSTSHRPGMTRGQWAIARVNAFLYLCSAGRPENKRYITDNDLLHPEHPKYSGKRSLEERITSVAPPEYMQAAARKGLEYLKEGEGGDGLVAQTITDARKMASGTVTYEKWKKIGPWIARHLVDLDAPKNRDKNDPDYPGAGLVAHLLWGSGPSKADALRAKEYAEGAVKRIEDRTALRNVQPFEDVSGIESDRGGSQMSITAEELIEYMDTEDNELRVLPDNYRPATAEDVPEGRACGNCAFFNEEKVDAEGRAYCEKWDDYASGGYYCNAWQPKAEVEEDDEEDDDSEEMEDSSSDTKYMRNADFQWVIKPVNEKRAIAYTSFECRQGEQPNTLIGYAAVFDSPSEPMPWTEYVKRGAFQKTLNDGADVRLLIDHVGVPLARTKSGTLTLREDDRGLRVEARLDPANPDAARIISALERGDLSQMSFAFRSIKDSWSDDRKVRELREVQLFDVSVVTFPAYADTIAEIRSGAYNLSEVAKGNLRLRQAQIRLATLK